MLDKHRENLKLPFKSKGAVWSTSSVTRMFMKYLFVILKKKRTCEIETHITHYDHLLLSTIVFKSGFQQKGNLIKVEIWCHYSGSMTVVYLTLSIFLVGP